MFKVTLKNGLQTIKFNNPKLRNALASTDIFDLTNLLNNSACDDQVKVTVLTGEGEFYSSGNNIRASLERSQKSGDVVGDLRDGMNKLTDLVHAFVDYPKLLIGLVNGPAIGVAATTLAHCDVIYAHESAYFYTPFSLMGLSVEGAASYTFPRILGRSKASEMLLLNHKMSVQEAKEYNFISRIYKTEEIPEIEAKLEGFAKLPIGSIMATKKLMKMFDAAEMKEAGEIENDVLVERFQSEEAIEAMFKFMTKKK